jgi:hypothetical protein
MLPSKSEVCTLESQSIPIIAIIDAMHLFRIVLFTTCMHLYVVHLAFIGYFCLLNRTQQHSMMLKGVMRPKKSWKRS